MLKSKPLSGKPGNRRQSSLKRMQAWFGKAISTPLPPEYGGNPLAISAPRLRPKAEAFLNAKHGLSGFDRLGIYNQQYWFRLLTIMQDEHPCAVHVLGLHPYNDWAARYLSAHPPSSPYLSLLDAEFFRFMDKNYRGRNRKAVLEAIAHDMAFSRAVDAPAGKTPAPGDFASGRLDAVKMRLAPHVTPLRLSFDLAAFRAACIRDESLEKRIALKRMASCAVVYRHAFLPRWKPISRAAYKLLTELRTPGTLRNIFSRLEGRLSARERKELEAHLQEWFREWTALGWLSREEESPKRAGRKRGQAHRRPAWPSSDRRG